VTGRASEQHPIGMPNTEQELLAALADYTALKEEHKRLAAEHAVAELDK
jgi:hypothetical protein